jgi:hypothetical protein
MFEVGECCDAPEEIELEAAGRAQDVWNEVVWALDDLLEDAYFSRTLP